MLEGGWKRGRRMLRFRVEVEWMRMLEVVDWEWDEGWGWRRREEEGETRRVSVSLGWAQIWVWVCVWTGFEDRGRWIREMWTEWGWVSWWMREERGW